MPTRLLYAVITLSVCVFAALVGMRLAATAAQPSTASTTGWNGFLRPDGARAPDFTLRDQDGKRVTMDQYRGRPLAVTFVFSTCDDTCPAIVDQVRGALDETGLDIPLLAVSVDPANDTPELARRFLAKRRMTGRARFLLGDRRALKPVWDGYGVWPETAELSHTASVVLVDAQGRQRVGFPHDEITPTSLGHDLRRIAALQQQTRPRA